MKDGISFTLSAFEVGILLGFLMGILVVTAYAVVAEVGARLANRWRHRQVPWHLLEPMESELWGGYLADPGPSAPVVYDYDSVDPELRVIQVEE